MWASGEWQANLTVHPLSVSVASIGCLSCFLFIVVTHTDTPRTQKTYRGDKKTKAQQYAH